MELYKIYKFGGIYNTEFLIQQHAKIFHLPGSYFCVLQ